MAEAGQVADRVWRLLPWDAALDAQLGELFSPCRRAILADLRDGKAQVYGVSGPDYSGAVLLRYEDTEDGRLVCNVLAAAGRGMRSALVDLRRLAAAAGVNLLRFESSTPAHARLYESMGAREVWRVHEIEVLNEQKIE